MPVMPVTPSVAQWLGTIDAMVTGGTSNATSTHVLLAGVYQKEHEHAADQDLMRCDVHAEKQKGE
jgi:hypothetical protein